MLTDSSVEDPRTRWVRPESATFRPDRATVLACVKSLRCASVLADGLRPLLTQLRSAEDRYMESDGHPRRSCRHRPRLGGRSTPDAVFATRSLAETGTGARRCRAHLRPRRRPRRDSRPTPKPKQSACTPTSNIQRPSPHRCRTDVHPRRRHRTTRTRHPSSVHTPPTCSPTSASSRQRSPRSPPPARVIGTGPFTPTAEPANRSQRTGSEQTRSMPVCFQTHGRSADTLGDPACSGHLHESVQTRLPATPALDASMQCEFVAPRPELSGAGVDAYANIDGAGGHRADRFVTANGAQRTRTDLGVAGFTELMTFSEEHAVTTRCAPLACQPCAASA